MVVETGEAPETEDEVKVEKLEKAKAIKDKVFNGIQGLFKGITSNIELILGTIIAIILQAIASIFNSGTAGEGFDFSILYTVLEFVIGPFIMLLVFKSINQKIDDKVAVIYEKYQDCKDRLSKVTKDYENLEHKYEIETERKTAEHKLKLEELRYMKDIEIAQLKTSLDAKNTEISTITKEMDRLKKEFELRISS